MELASPDTQSSPSILADWLELQALFANRKRVRRSELDSIFRMTEEERSIRLHIDADTGERDDGEILESELESMVLNVSQELSWRLDKMGAAYPFMLNKDTGADGLAWELIATGSPTSNEYVIYIACLLIVAYRRGLFITKANDSLFTNHKLGKIFQFVRA
jgi:hypothetical protein